MQTSYSREERIGRAGSPYDSDTIDSVSRIAEVAMRPGDLALRGTAAATDGKGVKKLTAPSAADPDAIVELLALAATATTISGSGLDGVIGGGRMVPARNIVLVLNSHADWDVGVAVVTGEDEHGREITEEYSVPDAGNTTLVGKKHFSKVTSVLIPAGASTNRTVTVGTGTLLGALTARDVVGLVRYLAARQLERDATSEFAANDVLVVITKGRVWVEVELDVLDGQQVYVRLVAAGEEVIGGFRTDRDGTISAPDAVPVIGMRFVGDSVERDGTKFAVVECVLISG